MPAIPINDIEICYESFGDSDASPLLLGTGHDLPRRYRPQIAEAIFNIAAQGEGL